MICSERLQCRICSSARAQPAGHGHVVRHSVAFFGPDRPKRSPGCKPGLKTLPAANSFPWHAAPWRVPVPGGRPAGPAKQRALRESGRGAPSGRGVWARRGPPLRTQGWRVPPSTRSLLRLVGQGRQGIARDDVDERMQQVVGPAIGSPEGARSQLLVKHRLLTTDVSKADLAVLGCRELD